jgi:hypothetical protein
MYGLPYQPIHWFSRTTFFRPKEKETQPQSFREGNKFIAAYENAEKFRRSKRHDKMFLCAANLSVFEAILVAYMRPFFVFLGLLLWLILIRADEQVVIKDSEAIRYVGRYVEVCGLVISVTTSPFGTAFINFGREYPNQSFAGFIPADSGITADQITKLQGKIIGIVGTIELHKGKPEIKIMSMYQIVDLSSKLAE